MGLEAIKQTELCTLIKIKGRFDFSCHASFRKAYAGAPASCEFLIDMDETTYMDSSALGMLLLLREYVQQQGGRVSILNCRGHAYDVLEIANFHRLFKIHP